MILHVACVLCELEHIHILVYSTYGSFTGV